MDEPEQALLSRAAAWPALGNLEELDAATLRDLANSEGIDFATAVLYDRLCRSPRFGHVLPSEDRIESKHVASRTPFDFDVIVVPGAFHAQRAETGADGRRVMDAATRLGCETTVVDVPSFGSPASNAAKILQSLAARRDGRGVVLVSLSKGSLDVLHALQVPADDEVWRGVDCWISLSGMATGSPLIGWLRRRPWRLLGLRLLFAWHGLPFRVLGEIDREEVLGARRPKRAIASAQRLGLRVVHVVGFPLRRHLSCPLARRGHRRLAPLGPNDGGVLLADVCQLPGTVYPVWGADHYLRLPDADVGAIFADVFQRVASAGSAAMAESPAHDRA